MPPIVILKNVRYTVLVPVNKSLTYKSNRRHPRAAGNLVQERPHFRQVRPSVRVPCNRPCCKVNYAAEYQRRGVPYDVPHRFARKIERTHIIADTPDILPDCLHVAHRPNAQVNTLAKMPTTVTDIASVHCILSRNSFILAWNSARVSSTRL